MKTKLMNIVMFVLCLGFLTWLTACDDGSTITPAPEVTAICGNAVTEDGEACDDGNTADGDTCSADCLSITSVPEVTAICGNGSQEDGEACDDGNTADGDTCSADCLSVTTPPVVAATCGNGTVEEGEACDGGDACSSACELLNTGVDNDQDGYTTKIDCNDNDATVYPSATEFPEDGIDQNCLGGDQLVVTRTDTYADSTGAPIKIG